MKETASQRKKDKVLRTSMYVAVLIGLAGFLIFSILAAITFGNADLSLKDVYSVIAYKLFHIKSLSAYAEGAVHDVVWLIRLPRVLLALAVGMALSVCGVYPINPTKMTLTQVGNTKNVIVVTNQETPFGYHE